MLGFLLYATLSQIKIFLTNTLWIYVMLTDVHSLQPYSLEDDLFWTELKDRRGADGIMKKTLSRFLNPTGRGRFKPEQRPWWWIVDVPYKSPYSLCKYSLLQFIIRWWCLLSVIVAIHNMISHSR